MPIERDARFQRSGVRVEQPVSRQAKTRRSSCARESLARSGPFSSTRKRALAEGADLLRVGAHIVAPGVAGVVQHDGARPSLAALEHLRSRVLVENREGAILPKPDTQVFIFEFAVGGVDCWSRLARGRHPAQTKLPVSERRHGRAEHQLRPVADHVEACVHWCATRCRARLPGAELLWPPGRSQNPNPNRIRRSAFASQA